jgi:rhomboid protease GluP
MSYPVPPDRPINEPNRTESGGQQAAPQPAVRVQPPVKTPWVTYCILGFTILVFVLQEVSLSIYNIDLPSFYGAKVNDWIMRGELWRLITPMLLHLPSNLLHIGFNMYALFSLGPLLERHFGHGRFLALYLLSGFAGNVASFVFTPAPSVGSSTAIFGLLAAMGVFLYQNKKLFAGRGRQALTQIILIAAINLVIGLTPGIDDWGHVGGLLAGILFTWFGGPLLQVEGIYPNFTLADQRESRVVILTWVLVAALFTGIVILTIISRGG